MVISERSQCAEQIPCNPLARRCLLAGDLEIEEGRPVSVTPGEKAWTVVDVWKLLVTGGGGGGGSGRGGESDSVLVLQGEMNGGELAGQGRSRRGVMQV